MPTPGQDHDSLPMGFELGEYRITKVLGRGGFAITYLAQDRNLVCSVAIKEYFPIDIAARRGTEVGPKSTDDLFNWGLNRFLDEGKLLARFRHRNIVRVSRLMEANGTAYLVMDFEAGDNLNNFCSKCATRPNQDQIIEFTLPLLDGLSIIHNAGYMHRDIKPANILVRESDRSPVLIDFGAARDALGTKNRTVIVSPGFTPIEQYDPSSEQGPWTDIYAMGSVLYWLVTRSKPATSLIRKYSPEATPPATVAAAGLYPQAFLAAIDWAMAVEPSWRPQDLLSWRAALVVAKESALRAATRQSAAVPSPAKKKLPTLRIGHGKKKVICDAAKDKILIGRSTACDIIINDPAISRKHAVIEWSDGRFQIKDFSQGGTYLRIGDSTALVHNRSAFLNSSGVIGIGELPGAKPQSTITFQVVS